MVNARKPDSIPKNPYKWDDGKLNQIRQMLSNGVDLHDVAREMGEPYDILQGVCRKFKIDYPKLVKGKTFIYEGVCKHCGNEFSRKLSHKMKIPDFCSQKCSTSARKKKPVIRRTKCPNCGEVFEWVKHGTVQPDRIFHNRACLLEFQKKALAKVRR
jgi:endogenous inhibitor of DNA gyrase (YacG/DUF329 family)